MKTWRCLCLTAMVFSLGCATHIVHHPEDKKPTASAASSEAGNRQIATESADAPSEAATPDAATKPVVHESPLAAAAALQAEQEAEIPNVAAEKALGWLKNGNIRFVKNRLRKDGQSALDRARLVEKQSPHSIVLSCSDSRVPPEIIFDQKLGEIFVVRTAGESLDSAIIASLEYSVEHLGTRLLVIMGHENCGAVKASMGAVAGKSNGSPNLDYMVNNIRPHLKDNLDGRKPASTNLAAESFANAKGVAADLILRSKIIAEKVKKGQLRIEPALYHLQSGQVDFQ